MTTWEEIRDEIAGMLADGKPLEDVIAKLDEMNKPKPMTNEEWLKSMNTEQLAEWIVRIVDCEFCPVKKPCKKQPCKKQIEKWLKQPHK